MKIEWNRVTWYSKLLAVFLALIIFALGFYSGIMYEMLSVENNVLLSSIQHTPQIISTNFTCDAGKTVHATFFNNMVTMKLSDGRTMNLPQTISADGGRYANTDESVVFWTKGDGAFVEENGTTTFSNCITKQD